MKEKVVEVKEGHSDLGGVGDLVPSMQPPAVPLQHQNSMSIEKDDKEVVEDKAEEEHHSDLSCVRGVHLIATPSCAVQAWCKEDCIMGIDEAGRGPVLGPMVYACMFAPATDDLKSRAFADSKTLTAAKRDQLFDTIIKDGRLGWVAEILSADFISTSMLGKSKTSLNVVAMNSTVKIIAHALSMGAKITQVFVDTVGDPERHEATLLRHFPALRFTVCPKADALYPVVSGASIVAKVTRDRALLQCQKDLGLVGALGTGYPGDSATQAWLSANLQPVVGWPAIVRFSWETCARLLKSQGAAFEWEADADDAGESGGQQQRINFGNAAATPVVGTKSVGSAAAVESSGAGRHAYFRVRKLQRVGECF